MNSLPFDIPDDPEKYPDWVCRHSAWLRRHFGAGVRATDAIHDVLLRVIQRQKNGEKLPPRGFRRAVMRKVFDQFRRNHRHERFVDGRRRALEDANGQFQATSPTEEAAIARETQTAIDQIVKTLPPFDRTLWELLVKGASHQQIADATGRTVQAVKQAAYRLRLRFQNSLSERCDHETSTEEGLGDD